MQTLERTLAAQLYKRLTGEDIRRPLAYDDLTAFKRLVYRGYDHAAHLELLDRTLEQVTRYVETGGREGVGRVIIEMPPRHGKTMTTSRLYPIWHLGRNPEHRIMLVSYGQDLANKNSRAARNMIKTARYNELFNLELAGDSAAVTAWDIAKHGGGVDALGIGAGATGKGAHLLIIDDPLKSRAEAESATYRNKIYDAYRDDLYTRLEPGGAVLVMATRWHEDDLTGRLLRTGEGWRRLRLPALAEERDLLERESGAALWPARFPLEVLYDIRDTLGPYSWAALYQQAPQPPEGGILKRAWFEPRVRVIPERAVAVRFWDLAMSSKESADFTVGVRLERGADGRHYVTDVRRAQVEFADLPRFLTDTIISDGPRVYQGFELAGYMTRAIQQIAKDTNLSAHVIKGYRVEGDKLTRVLPFAARASLGLIGVADEPFSEAYIDELASFPSGKHDDQVDASSGAWQMINEFDKPKRDKARASRYV